MSGGRPTIYTREAADIAVAGVSSGQSLRRVCREHPELPDEATIRSWYLRDIDGFTARYTQAREMQADAMADELIDIADTPELGTTIKTFADGTQEVVEGDMINHRRLRYDARKWLMSKIYPKKYAERLQNQNLDKDGNPADPVIPVLNVTVSRE